MSAPMATLDRNSWRVWTGMHGGFGQITHEKDAPYLQVGGYALALHGYLRATTDIDVLVPPDEPAAHKVIPALLVMPEGAAADIDPAWFGEGENIRVNDAYTVDLLFSAAGQTYEALQPYAEVVEFDGIPIRTVNLQGLLLTKQTVRDKDQIDRRVLERAINLTDPENSQTAARSSPPALKRRRDLER